MSSSLIHCPTSTCFNLNFQGMNTTFGPTPLIQTPISGSIDAGWDWSSSSDGKNCSEDIQDKVNQIAKDVEYRMNIGYTVGNCIRLGSKHIANFLISKEQCQRVQKMALAVIKACTKFGLFRNSICLTSSHKALKDQCDTQADYYAHSGNQVDPGLKQVIKDLSGSRGQ